MSNITSSQIDRAGRAIRKAEKLSDVKEAVALVNTWRADHVFCINTFQITLKRYARDIDKNAIFGQRLKKIDSIALKLKLQPHMALSKMQDIGGCRVIFKNVKDVYELVNRYKKSSIRHELISEKDYIKSPKSSGYRGYHLAYRYYSSAIPKYNWYLIEIQIRTMMQHVWATTVETAGVFTCNSLKSSIGDEDWLKFFRITSRLIELYEMEINNIEEKRELKSKIEILEQKYKFLAQISAFTVSAERVIEKANEKYKFYLLKLNYETRRLNVNRYTNKEGYKAQQDYAEAEKSDVFNAVLVSGDSIKQLKKAYPNYFTNTKKFLELINLATKED